LTWTEASPSFISWLALIALSVVGAICFFYHSKPLSLRLLYASNEDARYVTKALGLSYFHCEEEDFISSLTQGNLEITRLAWKAS
jgi:hypothetical protein